MKKRNLKHVDSKNNDKSSSDEDDGDIFYDEVLGSSTSGTSEKPLNHISNRNISLRKIRSIESTIFKNSFLGLVRDKADLASFYQLIQSDVDLLQKVLGRDFTIIAVNEILLKLSKRYTQHRFPSKEAFMSYMGKVLSYEMRDAVQISSVDFKLNCNRNEQEVAQQRYLEEIEYNADTSNQLNQTIISQKANNSQGILRLGTGLTIAGDVFEVGGGYERNWQGKSRRYRAEAKVRVNF